MVETIGQQLRQAREARQLTLEQVTRATHIRAHYLQLLEDDRLEALPSEVQARGFLRTYANYLGLDAGSIMASLQTESSIPAPPVVEVDASPVSKVDGLTSQAGEQIFAELGQALKNQRELLGFSLEEVERHTHLRTHYLQALESGSLAGLPSPVQGRGMLSNYANFLGLDPEPLLLRFADGLQADLQARQAEQQAASLTAGSQPARRVARSPSRLHRFFSGELLIATVLVAFLAIAMIWASVRVFTMQNNQVVGPTAPSIAEVLLATPTETLTPTAPPPSATITVFAPLGTPLPTGSPPPASSGLLTPGSGLQVYVTVRHRAWMRALVDEEIEFEGRVLPGNAYAFAGDERVEILTSDGSALQVFFNQQDLGPIGLSSQVIDLVFTRDGLQTPTPTITLTPTGTPRVSPTPTLTEQP